MAHDRTVRAARTESPPVIPDKLYFRIGEVAQLLNLPTYVLRFWESEFPHLRPTKGGTGQRLYRRGDVEALVEVRRLLYEEGYTIPGARRMLQDRTDAPKAPYPYPEHPEETPESDHTRDAALQQVHTGLREISEALGRPAGADSLPAQRGSLPNQRKRMAFNDSTPSLFAWAENEETPDA